MKSSGIEVARRTGELTRGRGAGLSGLDPRILNQEAADND